MVFVQGEVTWPPAEKGQLCQFLILRYQEKLELSPAASSEKSGTVDWFSGELGGEDDKHLACWTCGPNFISVGSIFIYFTHLWKLPRSLVSQIPPRWGSLAADSLENSKLRPRHPFLIFSLDLLRHFGRQTIPLMMELSHK